MATDKLPHLKNQVVMSKNIETVKLKNVSVKYAKVIRPGKAYDESHPEEWSVNMYVTDEDREVLMAHGVNPKEDKQGQEYFIAKRKTIAKSGEPMKPPTVVDAKKAPVTDDIGNGSICNIVVTPFPWEKGKKKGVTLFLNAVQVVNHIRFGNAADEFEVIEDEGADHF
jgi:hypothetical protein